MAELVAERPAAVITTATSRPAETGVGDELPAAYVDAWRELSEAGPTVVAIRDNPWLPFERAGLRRPQPGRSRRLLGAARHTSSAGKSPIDADPSLGDLASFIDLSDYFLRGGPGARPSRAIS